MTLEDTFAAVASALADRPGVRLPDAGAPRRFGSTSLTVDGRIFAMLVGGRLVVKLPRGRVGSLLEEGLGDPFTSGTGRPMREWVAVRGEDEETWLALATEALAFVGGARA